MMFHKIPKVIHVYWGSSEGKMSFLRYASLLSIKKFCPDWKLKLHMPLKPGGAVTWKTGEQKSPGSLVLNYFKDAMAVADEVIAHDFEKYGFPNGAHEVHKADFIRWHLLSSEGGFWSDLDILFFNNLSEIKFTSAPEDEKNIDTVIHIYDDFKSHAIGLLGACPNNPLFTACKQKAYTQNLTTYQAVGAELLNDEFKTLDQIKAKFPDLGVANMTKGAVYHISPLYINKLYSFRNTIAFPSDAVGCHWFGGHPAAQALEIQVQSITNGMPKNTVTGLIRNVLR